LKLCRYIQDATNVEVTGDDGVKTWRTNVQLNSITSNQMTGKITCRRADVTVAGRCRLTL
jgi:hypothetical protein